MTDRTAAAPTAIEVFYDYSCPYAYAGSNWLREVRAAPGDSLAITWRMFSLEQVNSELGEDWKIWEQPIEHTSKGLEGFRAALAARQQGDEAFEAFHFAWFEARHGEKESARRPSARSIAEEAGLDMARFDADAADSSLWATLGEDHARGVREFGVFGVPTIVFPGGEAAYIRMRPALTGSDAVEGWREFTQTVVGRPTIAEIKRPSKPK